MVGSGPSHIGEQLCGQDDVHLPHIYHLCTIGRARRRVCLFSDRLDSARPSFASEIDIAGSGSLANLPTIMSDCGMLVCPAPVFAPLTGFEIQGTGSPRFTLVDFKLPVNPAAYDFPMWSISPGGIFFIDEEDNVEYDVRLSSNPVTLIVDDEGSILGACIEANACQAFGTFVDVTTAPEPPSWQIFTAALAGMLVVALRKRRAIGGSQRGDRPPA